MRDDLLFVEGDLRIALDRQRKLLVDEVKGYDRNKLLNTSTDDLVNYLVEKLKANPIELDDQNIETDTNEEKVDLRRTNRSFFLDDDDNPHVDATFLEVHVPFSGDEVLFKLKPSQYNFNPPQAKVHRGTVQFSLPLLSGMQQEAVKSEIASRLNSIRQYLEWQRTDLDTFNHELPDLARRQIEDRKKRVLAEQGLQESLGFKMKRREDSPLTYAAEVKRKITPPAPSASNAAYKPEPALTSEMYEDILGVIQRMAEVLERSPKAFAGMGEEDLRTHFLVQLNGVYEGAASGETFNAGGKTDIFLPSGGGNVFVAECKFWSGEKAFGGIVDQLFGYITWRDTKVAILLFSRNKDFSAVVDSARSAAEAHPHFKRRADYNAANGFRGVYGHPNDANREVIVTTLVFDVPTA